MNAQIPGSSERESVTRSNFVKPKAVKPLPVPLKKSRCCGSQTRAPFGEISPFNKAGEEAVRRSNLPKCNRFLTVSGCVCPERESIPLAVGICFSA